MAASKQDKINDQTNRTWAIHTAIFIYSRYSFKSPVHNLD